MTAIHFTIPLSAQPPRWRGRLLAEADDGRGDLGDRDDRGERGDGRPHGGRGGRGRGRGRRGPGFGPGPGRRRAPRGDVRNAVLALLAEEPLHGYAVIGLLAERSGGLWRPSPGSVYPVLNQLEDDGLVSSAEAEGRKVFSLTDAGTAYVEEHADELREPWTVDETRHRDRAVTLFDTLRSLAGATHEVARGGTQPQVDAARAVLEGARRSLYRILAEEPDGAAPPAADQPAQPDDPQKS